MPLVADALHRPTFADWFWWAVMTAASGVLGIVLYVLFQGEMQGFSAFWSCAPLVAAYFGCPLTTHTKLLFAPLAMPAVLAPAVLITPMFLLEPQLAARGYIFQHPPASAMGSVSPGFWSSLTGIVGLRDDRRIAQLRTLRGLTVDPLSASRVRGCQLLVGSVRSDPSALSSDDLDRVIACAIAAQ